MERPDPRSIALLVGGMACFGSATPVSAIAGRAFPSLVGSALRMTAAAAVLVPLYALARRRGAEPAVRSTYRSMTGGDRLLVLGIAGIGTFGFSVLMMAGMRHAPGAVAAVVMATTPVVTAIGAVVFLGDHLDGSRIVAVVLSAVGVVVVDVGADVSQGAGSRVLLGAGLVFGAVVCEAAYTLMGKRLTVDLSPLAIVTSAAVVALVMFAVPATWEALTTEWSAPSVGEFAAILWWGMGTMALGSWLWFRGMQRVSAGTAAPFMGVMPLSALLLSYLLLGERPQWSHLIGMTIVLCALVLVVRSDAQVH